MRDIAATTYMGTTGTEKHLYQIRFIGGNIQRYKDDLTYIDRMEDVFNVRLDLFGGDVEKALKGQFK